MPEQNVRIGFDNETTVLSKEQWVKNWKVEHSEEPEMRQKRRRMERDWEKFNERNIVAR